jgi:hypothetical protein
MHNSGFLGASTIFDIQLPEMRELECEYRVPRHFINVAQETFYIIGNDKNNCTVSLITKSIAKFYSFNFRSVLSMENGK